MTGASRGLGAMIAATLAAAGWEVFGAMRNPAGREHLDELLRRRGVDPRSIRVVGLDVLDRESIRTAVTDVLDQTAGRLDAVVAGAGITVVGAFEEVTYEAASRVMETNFFGAAETVRAALPSLRLSGGRVVVISSDSGFYGGPCLSAYTASKHALEGWAESLAYEIGPLGVGLSIIEPGVFRSDLWNSPVTYEPAGPYATLGRAFEQTWRKAGKGARSPEPVGEAVLHALESRRPKLRYLVGRDARRHAALKRFLPSPLLRAYTQHASRSGT